MDLGGAQGAANPLGIPLSGPLAKAVSRGYHLAAMPANRLRTASTGYSMRCCPASACSWA